MGLLNYEILESKYKEFVGAKHAVACSSGTAALHLALLALGIGPGDEVILPDFTMAAVAFAVSYVGAVPKFADVDMENYAIQPSEIKRLMTKKTKAIIVVHTYGRLAPMKEILKVAGKIPVIEDACEAQGAVYKSKAALTCFSFFKNKIIHAEEGGMITTDNLYLAQRMRFLKNMAFNKAHDYFHTEIGYNYRMPESQAVMVLESLLNYDQNRHDRRIIEHWYNEHLPGMSDRDAVWFFEYPAPKSVLKQIPQARDSFKPLSSFPMYKGRGLPNALKLSKKLILFPVNPEMSEEDVKTICATLLSD